jgi:hypothetical protein
VLTLSVSIKEILDVLKQNITFPEILKNLSCEKNILSLAIHRKDASSIPINTDFNFSSHNFKLTLNSEEIKSLADITFSVEELLDFLKANVRFPAFLESLEYNDQDNLLYLTIPKKGKIFFGEKPLLQNQLEFISKLIPDSQDKIQLRVDPLIR